MQHHTSYLFISKCLELPESPYKDVSIHFIDYLCWCVIYSFEDRISYAHFCEFVVNVCSNKHMSASSKVFMYIVSH